MSIWVDTDFGFDDLWALLVLWHLKIKIDGVSLVAGNSPLQQVVRNALGAKQVFGFDWPLSAGADRPIERTPETAERILGPGGMQSRGQRLPQHRDQLTGGLAIEAWLDRPGDNDILALGPLTNLAILFRDYPEQASKVRRITWMGGSAGRGNHTASAEFNAFADPEALELLLQHDAPLEIIDLQLCRRVTFGEAQLENSLIDKGGLLYDLVGGYLDIALSRGRTDMAVYDPVAALAIAAAASIEMTGALLTVCTEPGQDYGQTRVMTGEPTNVQIATDIDVDEAIRICFASLERDTD